MSSTFTPNLTLEEPANGDYVNSWNVPLNANLTALDTAIGGSTTINVVGASGTVALTLTQYRNRTLIFSGALTANVNYQVPTGVGGFWFIVNSTSGAYTLTISSGGAGTSYNVPQGYGALLACDGTNVRLGTTVPVSAAGSSGQVQYNAAGSLSGSSGLTFDGTNLTVSNVNGNLSGNITGNVAATGNPVGYKNIPASGNTTPSAADVGYYLTIPSGTTINSGIFNAGDTFLLYNSSSSAQSITQGSGVTLRLTGTSTTGTRTLAGYGLASVMCVGSNTFLVAGAGLT